MRVSAATGAAAIAADRRSQQETARVSAARVRRDGRENAGHGARRRSSDRGRRGRSGAPWPASSRAAGARVALFERTESEPRSGLGAAAGMLGVQAESDAAEASAAARRREPRRSTRPSRRWGRRAGKRRARRHGTLYSCSTAEEEEELDERADVAGGGRLRQRARVAERARSASRRATGVRSGRGCSADDARLDNVRLTRAYAVAAAAPGARCGRARRSRACAVEAGARGAASRRRRARRPVMPSSTPPAPGRGALALARRCRSCRCAGRWRRSSRRRAPFRHAIYSARGVRRAASRRPGARRQHVRAGRTSTSG